MAVRFVIGDIVQTITEVRIDYSDCGNYGIETIPEASVGEVVGPGCRIHTIWCLPVRFQNAENHPVIFVNGIEAGPGHYVDERMLRAVERENPEIVGCETVDELLNCIYGK